MSTSRITFYSICSQRGIFVSDPDVNVDVTIYARNTNLYTLYDNGAVLFGKFIRHNGTTIVFTHEAIKFNTDDELHLLLIARSRDRMGIGTFIVHFFFFLDETFFHPRS